MYGMVNEGIRCFVEDNHGPAAWQQICEKAAIDHHRFERMVAYDDGITYQLVGAVCDQTGLSTEEALKVFGAYWVEFAGNSSLGNLLDLAGHTFVEKIRGLDDMHERILMSMPHLKPPSFELRQHDETTFHLHYYSSREGLAPMVIGLLHGLADRTDENIRVEHIKRKSDQSDHDVFKIDVLAQHP